MTTSSALLETTLMLVIGTVNEPMAVLALNALTIINEVVEPSAGAETGETVMVDSDDETAIAPLTFCGKNKPIMPIIMAVKVITPIIFLFFCICRNEKLNIIISDNYSVKPHNCQGFMTFNNNKKIFKIRQNLLVITNKYFNCSLLLTV